MNADIHKISLRNLIFQRNGLIALSGILSISLVLTTGFLFLKSERVVIVPPAIEKSFWVDSQQISPTYLEQFGYFLGELFLSKSAQSASSQRNIILRHTSPSFSTELNRKLLDEEKKLEKDRAAYVFFPTAIHTNIDAKEVILKGERTVYVAGKALSNEIESYRLTFVYQGGRLLLTGISEQGGNL